MPLFKKISFSALGISYDFRVNVDENGQFWAKIPDNVVKHTTLQEKEYASTFKELEGRIRWAIEAWREEEKKYEYLLRYRLTLSKHIKMQMPDGLMDKVVDGETLWAKTTNTGNHYYSDGETGMIFEFWPMVKIIEGENERIVGMEVATEDNWKIQRIMEQRASIERGEEQKHNPEGAPADFVYYEDELHKPFEHLGNDLLFVEGGKTYHDWSDSRRTDFWIPLTPESWEFFNGLNDMFVNIFSKMLSFLGEEDQQKLLANISHSISKGKLLM